MITVSLNNQMREIALVQSLAQALCLWGYAQDEKIAVAVNQQFVPKTQYSALTLAQGDQIDVVQAINGG